MSNCHFEDFEDILTPVNRDWYQRQPMHRDILAWRLKRFRVRNLRLIRLYIMNQFLHFGIFEDGFTVTQNA